MTGNMTKAETPAKRLREGVIPPNLPIWWASLPRPANPGKTARLGQNSLALYTLRRQARSLIMRLSALA
jgi:hypothetical protein